MFQLNEATRKTLTYLLDDCKHEADIPVDVNADGSIDIQAATQKMARRARQMFPLTTHWTKHYDESCKWWTYNATTPTGIRVHIYACREAPPTCRAIEEEYAEEENVPVAFETRTVIKKRIRWDCNGSQAKA